MKDVALGFRCSSDAERPRRTRVAGQALCHNPADLRGSRWAKEMQVSLKQVIFPRYRVRPLRHARICADAGARITVEFEVISRDSQCVE
jgi:hypothetical protein